MKLLGISGSLRQDSLNTRLLDAATRVVEAAGATVTRADLGAVPLYNGDMDTDDPPAAVSALKDAFAAADGLLIVSPEYNYSVPGVLKNAIDWASRPAFQSVMVGKPTAILSASMSTIGGARMQAHLKNILAGTLTPVYPAAEFLLATAHQAFDEEGRLVEERTRTFLDRYIGGYLAWAEAYGTG